jgi:hypothetical protein
MTRQRKLTAWFWDPSRTSVSDQKDKGQTMEDDNESGRVVEQERTRILATIIRLTGSGPRGAGTKFLILEDGSYVGT